MTYELTKLFQKGFKEYVRIYNSYCMVSNGIKDKPNDAF